ncbi:hypothetical protein GO755_33455 [Spirosoma sp. HMF4905]|uniref:Uncharacterized protein n=1 Tax=Spirosoma arboris TaxID=2682092 RepID=A0A7K1SMT9_9BACT|nr:hypothetical protein [Spirosoma arboris]MVM34983.1 hypothetical protein [Spirosoma arboris]
MALVDDLGKVVDGIDKISKEGVPIVVKHELDTPTVSYFALMAFLVVLAGVILVGVKDVIVHKALRT